jgi:TonB family protein
MRTVQWSRVLGLTCALMACSRPSPAPAPAPVPSAPIFSEAEVDVPARLLSIPTPKCPPEARRLGLNGRVEVEYVIGPDGRAEPGSIHVLRSTHYSFERPAAEAVRRARFSAARKHGQAVRVRTEQRFTFAIGAS